MERGMRGGLSGRLGPSCLRSDGLGRSGGLAFLSASPLDGRPATKTCWVAARTSSSSIEYLLAHLNKSSIVVGGFLASDSKNGVSGQMLRLKICRTTSMLQASTWSTAWPNRFTNSLKDSLSCIFMFCRVLIFCLCRAKHRYCPTKEIGRASCRERV